VPWQLESSAKAAARVRNERPAAGDVRRGFSPNGKPIATPKPKEPAE
jgi:hypothetical protein